MGKEDRKVGLKAESFFVERFFDDLPDKVKGLLHYVAGDNWLEKIKEVMRDEVDKEEAVRIKGKMEMLKEMYNKGEFGKPEKKI